MKEILERVLGLRAKFGEGARILIQKMDVKNAFRQIGVDPDGPASFAYTFDDLVFVDLRPQFGWRGSPGWWGVVSSAMQDAQRKTTRESATILQAGIQATEHVQVEDDTGSEGEPLPVGFEIKPAAGGGPKDTAWVAFFMDDAISVEVQWEKTGDRCLDLSRSLASIHFQAMGERGVEEEPLLSPKKVTNWSTQHEVLGFWLDTVKMSISLPDRKVKDFQERLEEWPEGRKTATVREVLVLAGKLHHAAYVVRPGRYFVRRLLQLNKLHLSGDERAGGGGAWGKTS